MFARPRTTRSSVEATCRVAGVMQCQGKVPELRTIFALFHLFLILSSSGMGDSAAEQSAHQGVGAPSRPPGLEVARGRRQLHQVDPASARAEPERSRSQARLELRARAQDRSQSPRGAVDQPYLFQDIRQMVEQRLGHKVNPELGKHIKRMTKVWRLPVTCTRS